MLNQITLVGRLVKDVEFKELEKGKKTANITLAVPRSYKNADGVYETDFIDCILWNNIAENTKEYCRKGDLIGVRGRLQTFPKANDEGFANGHELAVIAEKVTFLSNKQTED